MFHVKHFLAVISLLVMKCKLRYAIESIYYRDQGESLIYISFPIGICFKRVPVHSYPFPYLNPLPSSRARKRAAVRYLYHSVHSDNCRAVQAVQAVPYPSVVYRTDFSELFDDFLYITLHSIFRSVILLLHLFNDLSLCSILFEAAYNEACCLVAADKSRKLACSR